MRAFLRKHRELLSYLAFGLITIAVGLATYMLVFAAAEHILDVSMQDKTTTSYNLTYVLAQLLQWLVVLLVTFYTNRRWVFHSKGPVLKQLLLFSSSRIVTFFLDLIATYGVIRLFSRWLTPENAPILLGLKLDAEFWAKILVSALVIVINYIASKLLVFKKRSH
jgi:putative flippase GtrA